MLLAKRSSLSRRLVLPLAMAASMLLAGCPAIILGGATTGGVMAASKRTVGSQIEDAGIELKAERALTEEMGDDARYSVTSINRIVLVVGQAPSEDARARITEVLAGVENVRQVHNHMSIGGQLAFATILSDSAITTAVKSNMLSVQEEGFSTLDVKVVTENGVVYLMGLVTKPAGAIAIREARQTSGVLRAVALFEYVAAAEEPDTSASAG